MGRIRCTKEVKRGIERKGIKEKKGKKKGVKKGNREGSLSETEVKRF